MIRPTSECTSPSPGPGDAYKTLAERRDADAETRSFPSPDQLPVSAQTTLASLLAAARRPFAPSVAQLATEHLTFFVELRAMGARWPQVADFLFEQGLSGATGKITGNVWRATVSRALRNAKNSSPASVEEKSAKPTESAKADSGETSRPTAQQSAAERNMSQASSSERHASESSATRRKPPRTTAQNETKRGISQQSETSRNERFGNALERNVRGPPRAAPARRLLELRADSDFARITDLIERPFRTR